MYIHTIHLNTYWVLRMLGRLHNAKAFEQVKELKQQNDLSINRYSMLTMLELFAWKLQVKIYVEVLVKFSF